MPTREPAAPHPTVSSSKDNIDAVVRLEEDALQHRTTGEKVSDFMVRFVGTIGFMLGHVVLIAGWLAFNTGFTSRTPFDPYPFGGLALLVSTEGVFLAIFILISQNRMRRVADQRAHLNLQISLLAERETTRLLRMTREVAARAGVRVDDEEAQQLSEHTHLHTLASELDQKLPGDKG